MHLIRGSLDGRQLLKIAPIAFGLLFLFGCSLGDPDTASEPEVVVSDGSIRRFLAVDCCFRGKVRRIQLGRFTGSVVPQLAILGQTGVWFVDPVSFKKEQELAFESLSGETIWFGRNPKLIEHKDRGLRIMKGGGGYGDVGLLDQDGRLLWSFKLDATLPPNEMIGADLDDDGQAEFYVSDPRGLYRLNVDGKVRWSAKGAFLDIAAYTSRQDGERGIVALDRKSDILHFISPRGERIRSTTLKFKANGLEIVDGLDPPRLVVRPAANKIALIDFDGNLDFEHRFDRRLPVYHGPNAVAVRLDKGKSPYIAVLMESRTSEGKSVLSLFSSTGKLVYQEILSGGNGLLALPDPVSGKERLLVGDGTQSVWAYEKTAVDKAAAR